MKYVQERREAMEMLLQDSDILINYDSLVNLWYLEAFGEKVFIYPKKVKGFNSYTTHSGVKCHGNEKKREFIRAGLDAKRLLNEKLISMGILR